MPRLVVSFRPLKRTRYIYRSETYSHEALRKPLKLPAVVDSFTVSEDTVFSEYESLAKGQFALPGAGGPSARRLRATELRIFTADFDADWLESSLDPGDVHKQLTTIMRTRKAFELQAAVYPSPGYGELSMNATIRSVTRELVPGQANVRYFTVSIVEARKLEIERYGAGKASRKKGTKLPTTYTVDAGESLGFVSRLFYGSPNHWRLIAKANGIKNMGVATPFKADRKLRVPVLREEGSAQASPGGFEAPSG